MFSSSLRFVILVAIMVCHVGFVHTDKYKDCRCVTPQQCGDGGGFIKPRVDGTNCAVGETYCCVILPVPTTPPLPKCGIHEPLAIPGFSYGVGDVALHREFPWLVKILGKDGRYLGSGALIDSRRVLSVAHLFQNGAPAFVVVGMHTEVAVKGIKLHGEFNWVNLHNDVAMLYLEKELDLGSMFPQVGTVCLPQEKLQGNQHCVLSTFGENGYPIIRKVKMPLLDDQECEDRMRGTHKVGDGFLLNRRSFICAGGNAPSQDACEGQGGSALTCQVDGSYQLVGLVSWGLTKRDCSDRGSYPGVYLNVAGYKGWISRN